MSDAAIVIENVFDARSKQIWKALTNANEMRKWYFDVSSFEPVRGHEFSFTGIGEDGVTVYVHHCKVVEVIDGKKLSYSWRYKGYEGNSLLTFELEDHGSQTKLILTHAGVETFPANNPAFAKKNFIGGWTYFMTEGLPKYLDAITAQ